MKIIHILGSFLITISGIAQPILHPFEENNLWGYKEAGTSQIVVNMIEFGLKRMKQELRKMVSIKLFLIPRMFLTK